MSFTGLFQLAAVSTGFGVRGTHYTNTGGQPEVNKSAIIGMLAAAEGRTRDVSIDDLNQLKVGHMIINQGLRINRFSAVTNARQLDGKLRDNPVLIRRASFVANQPGPTKDHLVRHLIGIQSEDKAQIQALLRALIVPVFPIFLGRKIHTPAEPMAIGLIEGCLKDAFALVKVRGQATIEVTPAAAKGRGSVITDVMSNFTERQSVPRVVMKIAV